MKRQQVSSYDLAKTLEVKQPSVSPLITRKRGKIPESLLKLLEALDLELIAAPRQTSS